MAVLSACHIIGTLSIVNLTSDTVTLAVVNKDKANQSHPSGGLTILHWVSNCTS